MFGRNKILLTFGIIYLIFASVMYFGLKIRLQKNFTTSKLNEMVSGKSIFRDTTNDLCKYQILGDPKEVGNYVKINIFCNSGKKAVSTLSLSAFSDKTVDGFFKEYARIIGFDVNLIYKNNVSCYLDGKILTEQMKSQIIRPTSTIDCSENTINEK
ncbi:MAG: hypothetical protein WC784_00830 [Candidatus Shapirobacteria bacterium]|jgi:hypothetical protein